jgi:hypothetical protein
MSGDQSGRTHSAERKKDYRSVEMCPVVEYGRALGRRS